jgi:hypothetical protein
MAVRQLQTYPVDAVGLDRAGVRAKALSEQFGFAWVVRRYVTHLIYIGNKWSDGPVMRHNCKDIEIVQAYRGGELTPAS